MAYCPKDPNILLSLANMKLRDQYPTLDALCDGQDWDRAALEETLASIGYRYDGEKNAFV